MTADLYYPRSSQRAAPLAIVMPGFGGVKALFTNAGHDLASAGYATLVVEQLRPVPDTIAAIVVRFEGELKEQPAACCILSSRVREFCGCLSPWQLLIGVQTSNNAPAPAPFLDGI